MKQKDFEDVFIIWLSGAAEMKNGNEIYWTDEFDRKVTIQFLIGEVSAAIVRCYREDGSLDWETEYKDGKRNGYSRNWYDTGIQAAEFKYKDGELIYDRH